MDNRPIVLGINAAYHETSAALIRGGKVVCAIEEERLSRIKHGKKPLVDNPDVLPWMSIDEVLRYAAVEPKDLDAIAYSLMPGRRQNVIGLEPPGAIDQIKGWGTEVGEQCFEDALQRIPVLLENKLGIPVNRFFFIPHHIAHGASVFYTSKYCDAAIMVLDGIGEDTAGLLGIGLKDHIFELESISYPHSLGFLWERFALFLGFSEYDAAKVMGLAAYGDPNRFHQEMEAVLYVPDDPLGELPYKVNGEIARLRSSDFIGLETLFGPARTSDEPYTSSRISSIASALQYQTEKAILNVAKRLLAKSRLQNLCYSGGVALNCVANTALERAGLFQSISMINACHDAGTSIGAALEVSLQLNRTKRRFDGLGQDADLGATNTDDDIEKNIIALGIPYERVDNPAKVAATALSNGQIVGWVHGRLEFGPRALGHRSILADPRDKDTKERINKLIKNREPFRPFGASVLSSELEAWFNVPSNGCSIDGPRRYMLLAYPIKEKYRHLIPAVTHVDGTCRIQGGEANKDTVYYQLLKYFYEMTGVPLILNTSFNDSEPIVNLPRDAIKTAIDSKIDLLIIGNFVLQFT